MCMALPYRIVSINRQQRAEIEVDGVRREISVELLPDVKVGDYVLVYLGSAKTKLSESEAAEIISLLEEMAAASALEVE
ncbi:MAG: HypC/HybG/HupF family hydrogenase formation chaperone [Dehalococcoidia bacterium]